MASCPTASGEVVNSSSLSWSVGMAERGERAQHRRGLHELRPGAEHVDDRLAHLWNPFCSLGAANICGRDGRTPLADIAPAAHPGDERGLAARAEDPVRAAVLAWRVLPRPARRLVRRLSPYGRALALYGLPVVYEVRGFLEETWLSRRRGSEASASALYRASREMEIAACARPTWS